MSMSIVDIEIATDIELALKHMQQISVKTRQRVHVFSVLRKRKRKKSERRL